MRGVVYTSGCLPYVTYRPSEPLSGFVDYLWWLSDRPAHTQERILPTGTQELVINLHADELDIQKGDGEGKLERFSGAMVSGGYGKYFVADTRAHASLLGVHFKPGGGRALLGLPLGEIADQHLELAVLWGRRARELRERLVDAASLQERFRVLEAELVARLALGSTLTASPAVALALHQLTHQRLDVAAVADHLGLTRRRFIELFSAEVGMTPKLYARVQRFQRALARASGTALDWADVALGAGYCDQSHLIRDFVGFSGFAPTELMRHRGPAPKEHHLAHAGNVRPRRR